MDNFPILYLLTVPWHIRLSSFQILVTLAHGINKSWLAEKLPELTKISSGSLTANQKAGIRWARVTNSRVGLATSYTFGDGNYNFTFTFHCQEDSGSSLMFNVFVATDDASGAEVSAFDNGWLHEDSGSSLMFNAFVATDDASGAQGEWGLFLLFRESAKSIFCWLQLTIFWQSIIIWKKIWIHIAWKVALNGIWFILFWRYKWIRWDFCFLILIRTFIILI